MARVRSESVAALVTGEDWKRALTFAAQFRGRSFGNSMLIAAQHFAAYKEGRVPEPTPTYVAGFHQWLSLGRSVAKGQHGYGILAPVTGRFASFTPDDPNSWRRLARNEKPMSGEYARTRMIGVKPTYVWDPLSRDTVEIVSKAAKLPVAKQFLTPQPERHLDADCNPTTFRDPSSTESNRAGPRSATCSPAAEHPTYAIGPCRNSLPLTPCRPCPRHATLLIIR